MLDAELEDLEELMAETQSYLTFGNIEDIQWGFVVEDPKLVLNKPPGCPRMSPQALPSRPV